MRRAIVLGIRRCESFQVKAAVIGFGGDEEKYPCHFKHKIGDVFIYDGEKFIGRICPHFSPQVVSKMIAFHASGPRQVPTAGYYYPFWYAPVSRKATVTNKGEAKLKAFKKSLTKEERTSIIL